MSQGGAVSLRRSDWRVDSIAHADAVALVKQWHYSSSAPNTSVARFGLFRSGTLENCEGVALYLPPTKAAGVAIAGDDWRSVLSLSRLACSPEAPKNAASFLLGRSMALIDRDRWPVLVTYADTNQGHTGAIYRATNWRCDGPVPAGDVWQMPDGSLCGRKRGGRNLSVADLRAMGAKRRPAAPKIRFVHDVRAAQWGTT
jgi:hypothetical protein